MSIYRSEAVATNTSSTAAAVVGTVSIPAGSSVTFWDTTGSGSNVVSLDVFDQFRANQSALNVLVSSGTVAITQDGLALTYAQFLTLFGYMVTALDQAGSINQLLSPTKAQPTQANGVPLVAQAPRDGSEWVVGTHNFSDPCTWFGDSVRVTLGTLTGAGGGKLFSSPHPYWVDMVSGRMHNESMWRDLQKAHNPSSQHGYEVHVFVDGVEAVMREPLETSGGDYKVLWETGVVEFFTSQSGSVVTASYSYANGSTFYLYPRTTTSIVVVENAAMNVTVDTIFDDTFIYSFWAFDTGSGTYVNMGGYEYMRYNQIIAETKEPYPESPAVGASAVNKALPLVEFRNTSRGMQNNRVSSAFNYTTVREIPYGAQLRIYNKHHRPHQGELTTMTLYCTERESTQ